MKNYWLNDNPKVDWDSPVYLQWLKEIWHVEIEEEPRHLWPGQYTIKGWYEHEKRVYDKSEKEWEIRLIEAWRKKRENKPLITDGVFEQEGEDYFSWNAITPSWCLHKDGTWNKALINLDDWRYKKRVDYPGIYTYEQAITTLGMSPNLPLKFEGYDKYLDEVVQNYNYSK